MENSIADNPTYLVVMNTTSKSPVSQFVQSSRGQQGYNTYDNGGYRSLNRNRGRGRYSQGYRSFFQRAPLPAKTNVMPITPLGVLGLYLIPSYNSSTNSNVSIY